MSQLSTFSELFATFAKQADDKVAALQTSLKNTQNALDLANKDLTTLQNMMAGITILLPSQDLADVIDRQKPGIYIGIPTATYQCSRSPTVKANMELYGNGAKLVFKPAAPGAAGITFESASSVLCKWSMSGPALVRIRGVNGANSPRVKGQSTAPGFPDYYPVGNQILNCEFGADMVQGVMVHGNAIGTVVMGNTFHQSQQDQTYDCGLHSVLTYNRYEGSRGEHCHRMETEGLGLIAEGEVFAYNWLDNRASIARKEDMTYREGNGVVVVGNLSWGWNSSGQNPAGGLPHGSPSFWMGNIMPTERATTRSDGTIAYGATIQVESFNTVYLDGNWFPGSVNAAMATIYAQGNMVKRDNRLVHPPAGYKDPFQKAPAGNPPTFVGSLIDLGKGEIIV